MSGEIVRKNGGEFMEILKYATIAINISYILVYEY